MPHPVPVAANSLIAAPAVPVLPVEISSAQSYIHAATSPNTRKAYQADIRHFIAWGGALPTTPEVIIRYVTAHAALLNPNTLARRLTAIRHWHVYQGFADPTAYPAVSKTLTGIRNIHGKPVTRAVALRLEDLQTVCERLQQSSALKDLRNNALLQIQFFAALRVSEVVALQVEWISWEQEGIKITLPRSKTDQAGTGQTIAIPLAKANTVLCPVTALNQWLEAAEVTEGKIFRGISKGGRLQANVLTPRRVNAILQETLTACGFSATEHYSSHSLRSGFATEASRRKASLASIMRQGRWKKVDTVMHYVQEGQRFDDNAAATVMAGVEAESK